MEFKNRIAFSVFVFTAVLLTAPAVAEDDDRGVEFSVDHAVAEPGGFTTVSLEVLNYVQEENTVGVSVPFRDDCEYFSVRQGSDSAKFGSSATFDVGPGDGSVPGSASTELRVNMPDQVDLDENESITCGLSVSSTSGDIEDLDVTVEASQGPIYGAAIELDNKIGWGMWLVEEHQPVNVCTTPGDLECPEDGFTVTGFQILLLLLLFVLLVLILGLVFG